MAKKEIKRIDVTPEWTTLMPMFFNWIAAGNESQKKLAKEEITRIAGIVDILMKHKNCGGITCKCGRDFDLT